MHKYNFKILVTILVISILSSFAMLMLDKPSQGNKIGKNFSEITQLLPQKDKPVLLHIFATWCKSCKADISALKNKEVHDKYEVVGMLWRDSEDRLAYHLEKYPNTYDRVIIDFDDKISFALGVIGVPETFIFDKNGMVIYNHIGTISKDEILNVSIEKH